MELIKLVNKYARNPQDFDYEFFEEATGLIPSDDVRLQDAIIAFDEAADSRNNCFTQLSRAKKTKTKSKMKKSTKGLLTVGSIGAAGFTGWWFLVRKTVAEKRQAINQWIPTTTDEADAAALIGVINTMTDAEIKSTYKFIFKYVQKNKDVPPNSKLFYQIDAISKKYGIFT